MCLDNPWHSLSTRWGRATNADNRAVELCWQLCANGLGAEVKSLSAVFQCCPLN